MKCEDNGLDRLKVLFARVLAALMLVTLLAPAAMAEEAKMDGFYDLQPLIGEREGETAVLLLDRTYYSGETIYKGTTGRPLNGSCALHCGAVLISNLRGEIVTGQQVAKANNRDIKDARRWTPFVSWGKVASAFGIDLFTENLAQYGNNLKNRGVGTDERRARKMAKILDVFRASGQNAGMMLHFNSSGRLNGSGTHRHAVVLMGYIKQNGEIVDLLINDSSVPAPGGACVRMSESSLPESILGQKKADQARARGENVAMLLMDYAVSCRWASLDEQ